MPFLTKFSAYFELVYNYIFELGHLYLIKTGTTKTLKEPEFYNKKGV